MEPSTSMILGNFPFDKARSVRIHQKETTHGSIPKKASQMNLVRHLLRRKPPLLRQRWPALPRAAPQLDIVLGFMKGSISPPPRLPSLSLRNHRGIQALAVRREEERQ